MRKEKDKKKVDALDLRYVISLGRNNTGQYFPSVLKIRFLGSIQTSDSYLPQDRPGNLYFASYHHECVGTLA